MHGEVKFLLTMESLENALTNPNYDVIAIRAQDGGVGGGGITIIMMIMK